MKKSKMDNSFLLQILYFDTRSCCRWLNRAVAELCSALYRRCRQTNSLRVVGGRVAPHGCLGQRRDGLGLVQVPVSLTPSKSFVKLC